MENILATPYEDEKFLVVNRDENGAYIAANNQGYTEEDIRRILKENFVFDVACILQSARVAPGRHDTSNRDTKMSAQSFYGKYMSKLNEIDEATIFVISC